MSKSINQNIQINEQRLSLFEELGKIPYSINEFELHYSVWFAIEACFHVESRFVTWFSISKEGLFWIHDLFPPDTLFVIVDVVENLSIVTKT